MNHTLFENELIYLANIEPEKDAEIESKRSHDAEYLRMLSVEYTCPLSAMRLKKRYERIEKKPMKAVLCFTSLFVNVKMTAW